MATDRRCRGFALILDLGYILIRNSFDFSLLDSILLLYSNLESGIFWISENLIIALFVSIVAFWKSFWKEPQISWESDRSKHVVRHTVCKASRLILSFLFIWASL